MRVLTPRPKQPIFIFGNPKAAAYTYFNYVCVNHDSWFVEGSKNTSTPKVQSSNIVDSRSVMITADLFDSIDVYSFRLAGFVWFFSDPKLSELVVAKTEYLPASCQNLTMD